ncbi:MAG: T9SS type A sorting domain-containing protein [Bacteroidetes bacterium]|nr:T9SS type A sorting domain-containing protein [Bacteroidota bacterium]MBT3749464.1 T9SS type A sorting domain-containing protein [Bacteroidota bacterium]MBT4401001.1 T9SS type A sorting domain-containing protein [Bacteroidota bacterium]MBT4408267.1 T9SS type A sorting domain-containing protein [Bacteroidota bacterium]MBT5426257.1 T9SS type A sorting domain-containing protein [Bacteroidota bacterium]
MWSINRLSLLILLGLFTVTAYTQTTIDLVDNTEISSGANIKINPGDYQIQDLHNNGLLRIVNKENVIIDGSDVNVSGMDTTGYLIYIENSTNVTIKNFKSASAFFYAIRAKNSSGITIEDNNLSYNQKDTLGWIFIWTEVGEALGGGVLLDQCTDSDVFGNTMVQQNDGVAMYHCDDIRIHDNTLNWNCGFGIRMNFTDNCNIHHNDCSHVNRITDPSDCAAILLIVSNNNTVEYNDLTYSGDGIFLGQYEHSHIPNNNYFAHNDCSYSPHNAIESTFADGNVFIDNNCNFSHYGLWLGYSFNNLVEDNEIIGNLTAGIAVDRGFENTFRGNEIRQNPYGFQLWEGGVIGPYGDQYSHSYYIYDNLIQGNMWGIHAINTEHLVAKGNEFIHNQKADIYLEGDSKNDTISRNYFNSPTSYFIQAMTEDAIEAPDNQFNPADRDLIVRKMRGTINWYPFVEGPAPRFMDQPPCDMAEPNAVWNIYADPGFGHRRDEVLEFDSVDFKVGQASVKLNTPRGWDVGINYRPGGDSIALWDLSENDTLKFWIKTIKNPNYGFQGFFIRIGNFDHSYYQYTIPASDLNNAHNRWRHYNIPLKGTSKFVRTQVGDMDFDAVNYVEFHADTWDFGYTLWVDGVQFKDCIPTGISDEESGKPFQSVFYPNPVSGSGTINFHLDQPFEVEIKFYNLEGRVVKSIELDVQGAGKNIQNVDLDDLGNGVYIYRIFAGKMIEQEMIVVQ